MNTGQTDAWPLPAPASRAYRGTVVRVDLRTACAATQLTDAEFAALRIGKPVAALGPVGNRIGLALARDARTLEKRRELMFRSGVPQLAMQREIFDRADLLRGRRAVARLTQIVTRLPPGRTAERLRYELERMMTSRSEFAESALLDDLRGGGAALTGPHQGAALRLLGASGSAAPSDWACRGQRARRRGGRRPRRARPVAAACRQPPSAPETSGRPPLFSSECVSASSPARLRSERTCN